MSLPRDETAFFGRLDELSAIERRFEGASRLLTVVGLGGIGKTRLALAAAERTRSRWPGGVAFAPLADARSAEAAVREIATAIGARVASESKTAAGIQALGRALAGRGRSLLVLDNVEQLGADARALVDGLLDGARELFVLATSREVIGVRGEEKLVLAPLGDADARALFVDRARVAAGGDIALADEDVAAIVRRLDRLPLAIELAASRLELLAPKELLARLGDKLDVLSDASGSTTMRATLDWSWELCSETERDVLAQASVFAAPFGIDAAEEVLGADVLDVLEALLRKSLLVRADALGAGGRARLGMFETVRSWARTKLDESGAAAELRRRHARVHLDEAERWAAKTYGASAVAALDALAELLPELLVAFETTREASPAEAARIVLALADLLLFRGLFELRAELFDAGAEAAARAGDDRLLARALVTKARVTLEVGRMADAEAELRRAVELAERAGDEVTRAEATRSLG